MGTGAGETLAAVAAAAIKLSSIGDSWRTPPVVLDAVRDFCRHATGKARITVDPCSGPGSLVDARRTIALPEDGLTVPWGPGVAFVNPPYSAPAPWMGLCALHGQGDDHAIALVNAATSERWWPRDMQAVCFWRGRVKFLDPDGRAHHSNTRPSALLYWGVQPALFEHIFDNLGWVVRT